MMNLENYTSEYRALKSKNGKLHEKIWRTGKKGGNTDTIRKEIEANERRMRTINYLKKFEQNAS